MYLQAHAALGWIVGTAAPATDRRLRNWCVLASCAPDIDAVAYVGGPLCFARWHHTFGHNVWLGLLLVGLAAWHHRDRAWGRSLLSAFLVAFCFASHLFTDATMTGWSVMPWWPLSRQHYMWSNSWNLADPINLWAMAIGFAAVLPLALWKKSTPLDLLFPKIDAAFVNAFRRRTRSCHHCEAACSNTCDACAKPLCLRHGIIHWRRGLLCASCR
jgi:hypothetical protein